MFTVYHHSELNKHVPHRVLGVGGRQVRVDDRHLCVLRALAGAQGRAGKSAGWGG